MKLRVYERKEDTPRRVYQRKFMLEWYKTLRGRWNRYSKSAKHKGFEFDIPYDFFCHIVTCGCDYCGEKNDDGYVGIDRIDSNRGYVADNIAPCCSICNRMKSNLSREEFITRCEKVASLKGMELYHAKRTFL